jgi:hypothetical protein
LKINEGKLRVSSVRTPKGSVRAESVLEPRMPECRQFIAVQPRKGRVT